MLDAKTRCKSTEQKHHSFFPKRTCLHRHAKAHDAFKAHVKPFMSFPYPRSCLVRLPGQHLNKLRTDPTQHGVTAEGTGSTLDYVDRDLPEA